MDLSLVPIDDIFKELDKRFDVNWVRMAKQDVEIYDYHLQQKLHSEIKEMCDFICNSSPHTKIAGKIESMAYSLAHHPLILNATTPQGNR